MKTFLLKILSIGTLTALLFTTTSCKKEKLEAEPVVEQWSSGPDSNGVVRFIWFLENDVFYSIIPSPDQKTHLHFKGSLTRQGNRLIMQFPPENFNGLTMILPEFRSPDSRADFYTLFDSATYTKQNGKLVINYNAYPSGQPEPASISFSRADIEY